MHMASTDFVSIKTAVRQLAKRIQGDAAEAKQWAGLSRNRGITEVADQLDRVIDLLDGAYAEAEAAANLLFEAQEKEVAHEHEHPHEH